MPEAFRKTLAVLMIDDSLFDRKLFAEIIKEIDDSIKVITLQSGKEAIGYFNSLLYLLPHYIFVDVNMPEMDGIETLKNLKKIEAIKSVPIYMYSTGDLSSYGETAKLLGATGCLTKLIDFDKSCRQLAAIIAQHKGEKVF